MSKEREKASKQESNAPVLMEDDLHLEPEPLSFFEIDLMRLGESAEERKEIDKLLRYTSKTCPYDQEPISPIYAGYLARGQQLDADAIRLDLHSIFRALLVFVIGAIFLFLYAFACGYTIYTHDAILNM